MMPLGNNHASYSSMYIPIKSDAYLNGVPDFVAQNDNYIEQLSTIHKVLYNGDYQPDINDVTYGKINGGYLTDIILLHREWFPMKYDKDYFKKFLVKKNYCAIGAFVVIKDMTYLIGCIMGEICSEERFTTHVRGILKEKKWYQYFSQSKKCAYINTIGVIDEFRKLKVGTTLLEKFNEEMKKRECIAIFLHTIEYNISAMKFYEKNGWSRGGTILKYYVIDNSYYEAQVMYFILQNNDEFQVVPILKEGDMEGGRRQRGCCQSFWIKLQKILNN